MPGAHARLAPSSSKRWMACTAAPLYVAALIEDGVIEGDKGSKYSQEGTEAHDWASRVLDNKEPLPLAKVPENFRPHIQEYYHVCAECEHGAGDGSLRLVEVKVPLFYSPGENGTVDFGFVRLDKDGELEQIFIRDLKYGAGVPVDAEGNTQLAIYAQSLIEDLETWWGTIPPHIPVNIGIHQPRYAGDESLKLWEITVLELKQFCQPIGQTVKRISKAGSIHDLEFAPSADVCQFCPAKGICKARLNNAFANFPVDVLTLDLFDDMTLPEIESVPVETLVALYAHKKDIEKYLTGVEEHLTALAQAGTKAPGTKLVKGRDGNREWKDVEAAGKFLGAYLRDGMWKPKELISPTKAEKALKEHIAKVTIETHMRNLTERAEGKKVLALASDERAEVISAMEAFSILTDEDEKD